LAADVIVPAPRSHCLSQTTLVEQMWKGTPPMGIGRRAGDGVGIVASGTDGMGSEVGEAVCRRYVGPPLTLSHWRHTSRTQTKGTSSRSDQKQSRNLRARGTKNRARIGIARRARNRIAWRAKIGIARRARNGSARRARIGIARRQASQNRDRQASQNRDRLASQNRDRDPGIS
jgi:hypothetical protein